MSKEIRFRPSEGSAMHVDAWSCIRDDMPNAEKSVFGVRSSGSTWYYHGTYFVDGEWTHRFGSPGKDVKSYKPKMNFYLCRHFACENAVVAFESAAIYCGDCHLKILNCPACADRRAEEDR